MRSKILITMGVILIIGFLTYDSLGLLVSFPVCSIIATGYGIRKKDKVFIRLSIILLALWIAYGLYALYIIPN